MAMDGGEPSSTLQMESLARHIPPRGTELEARYTQLSSPEMSPLGPKRKQGKLTENCVLQPGKSVKALALLMGAHTEIIFT